MTTARPAAVTKVVAVTGKLHTAYSGTTKKWSRPAAYELLERRRHRHGAGLDERPIAGATVTAPWTGAVVKTDTA